MGSTHLFKESKIPTVIFFIGNNIILTVSNVMVFFYACCSDVVVDAFSINPEKENIFKLVF